MPVERYIHQSLAAAGFVVIDSEIACTLRPDLWPGGGLVCACEFTQARRRNQFAAVPRTTRMTVRLAGIERTVMILTRSTQRLAERVEEVTGFRLTEIIEGEQAKPAGQVLPRLQSPVPDDVEGLQGAFKEPPRTCLQCDKRLADGRCQAAARGEFHQRPAHFRPTTDHPRRCIHYAPGHHLLTSDHVDLRTGRELWPELLAKVPATPTTAAQKPDPAGTIERAKTIVADMLKAGARPAAEIIATGQGANISERTIQRAAEQLGVAKAKDGNGGWRWALPEGARAVA